MKNRLIILMCLVFFSCGGSTSSNVTEVGNPTTTPTTKATVSALTRSLTQATTQITSSFVNNLVKEVDDDALSVTIQNSNFDCSYSISEKTLTCNCPEGGTMTRVLDSELSLGIGGLSFDHTHQTTYSDCKITACSEEVTLNGNVAGALSGTFQPIQNNGDLSISNATDASCSGMTSSSTDFGFDMDMTFDGSDVTFSGSFCMNSESISFATLAILQSAVDPNSECENFGP